ncbi:MAG: hypothetical protein IIC07_02840 [Proteobacteria bacterium]|nr:hypothetical protein [Pseudomonadota bacterium]
MKNIGQGLWAIILLLVVVIFSSQASAAEDENTVSLWLGITAPEHGDVSYTFWPNGHEAPEFNWNLPPGVSLEKTHWPEFQKITTENGATFGFTPGDTIYQEIKLPKGFKANRQVIRLSLPYYICDPSCRVLTLEQTWEITAEFLEQAALRPELKTPRYSLRDFAIHANAGTNQALTFAVNFLHQDGTAEIRQVYFLSTTPGLFPEGGVFRLNRSTAVFYENAFRGYISATPILPGNQKREEISGIILFEMADGGVIEALPTTEPNDFLMMPDMEREGFPDSQLTFWSAILFAFLGGIILNIMPCVLPVLALKVFSFMKAGTSSPKQLRADGLAYTAGILVSFVAVGGLLMFLRATFGDFSWGFQLQQPAFVFAITLLLFVVGLNFLGVFEITAGRLTGLGQKMAGKEGPAGAFSTGVLATIVATPCTAPFMATALAFGLSQPAGVGLAVFVALGTGLAFPYLALSFVPGLGKILPKPGPWMKTFKQFLAFPLFATVIWLVWILTIQTGASGALIALSALFLLALAAWFSEVLKKTILRTGVVAGLVVVALIPLLQPKEYLPTVAVKYKLEASRIELVEYDADALARLRADGTPVFLHFWAAWCPICIMHEEYVFLTDEFQDFVEKKGIVFMFIDNTIYTPENVRLMESFGRSGQPIDIFFPPGKSPVVMPGYFNTGYILRRLDKELSKPE